MSFRAPIAEEHRADRHASIPAWLWIVLSFPAPVIEVRLSPRRIHGGDRRCQFTPVNLEIQAPAAGINRKNKRDHSRGQ
jgi:hypothetical protein